MSLDVTLDIIRALRMMKRNAKNQQVFERNGHHDRISKKYSRTQYIFCLAQLRHILIFKDKFY